MSVDIIRTILLPVLLLTIIVAISVYFYKEGFAVFTYEKDPTCPVGSYSTKTGGICTGANKNTDSTGDLPSSFSGASDPTCAQGSGRSTKTGGVCTGPNPDYNYGTATATYNIFGNAGGSVAPKMTDSSGGIKWDLSYNPILDSPLFAASNDDKYNVYKFTTDSSGNTTDISGNYVPSALVNILTANAAPASAPGSGSAAAATVPKGLSRDDIKSIIRDELAGELTLSLDCPVEEDEEDDDCEDSISMKQGRALKRNVCKPYVATNNVPCWGC
jgi:hypothetical protein